jgi:hypothetical protein
MAWRSGYLPIGLGVGGIGVCRGAFVGAFVGVCGGVGYGCGVGGRLGVAIGGRMVGGALGVCRGVGYGCRIGGAIVAGRLHSSVGATDGGTGVAVGTFLGCCGVARGDRVGVGVAGGGTFGW